VIKAYIRHQADKIVVEKNNGGEMVAHVIRQTTVEIDGVLISGANLPIVTVWASRGKYTRAEPISVLWRPTPPAQPRAHLVGHWAALEDQLCTWIPGDQSPNNLDALVWAFTELFPNARPRNEQEAAGSTSMRTL
jgi:phage terminase large subunit-like protein